MGLHLFEWLALNHTGAGATVRTQSQPLGSDPFIHFPGVQAKTFRVILDSSLTAPSNPSENPVNSVFEICHSHPHTTAQTIIFSHMSNCKFLSLCLSATPHSLLQTGQAHSCFFLCRVRVLGFLFTLNFPWHNAGHRAATH